MRLWKSICALGLVIAGQGVFGLEMARPVRAVSRAAVQDCSDLTTAELNAVLLNLGCDAHCTLKERVDPLLARGRLLLPCLEDVFRHGVDAAGIPVEDWFAVGDPRPRFGGFGLFRVIDRIAPERALALAREAIGKFPDNRESLRPYCGYLIEKGEAKLALPRLVRSYRSKGISGRELAAVAYFIGACQNPAYVDLLRSRMHEIPADKTGAPRSHVEVAIMELQRDTVGLLRAARQPTSMGWNAVQALKRLGRRDLLQGIAEDPNSPHRAFAKSLLAGQIGLSFGWSPYEKPAAADGVNK